MLLTKCYARGCSLALVGMLFQDLLFPTGSSTGSQMSSLLLFRLCSSYISKKHKKQMIPFLFASGFCIVEAYSAVSSSAYLLIPVRRSICFLYPHSVNSFSLSSLMFSRLLLFQSSGLFLMNLPLSTCVVPKDDTVYWLN